MFSIPSRQPTVTAALEAHNRLVSAASQMFLDDPAYLTTVAEAERAGADIITARAQNMSEAVAKLEFALKLTENDATSPYTLAVIRSSTADIRRLTAN